MLRHRGQCSTSLISFSGMDGAGKSTQIESLRMSMEMGGLNVKIIRFWDDIALLTRFRAAAGHKIFNGEKGIGTPESPVNRQDKNVQSAWMTIVRLFLYGIDALSTRNTVNRALRANNDLIICDRYTYDEMANLSLSNPLIRTYINVILKLIPKPHIRFLLDADPIKARQRKPEYPLEFLYVIRKSYLALSDLIGSFTIISSMSIQEAEICILEYTHEMLRQRRSGQGL